MKQLFTAYPNYLADHFGKSSKAESGIIDKYLESRMKMRVDGKKLGHHTSASPKKCNNPQSSNSSHLNRANMTSKSKLKNPKSQLANSETSEILENMRKTNPYIKKLTSSNLNSNSNELYNCSNQNSNDVDKDESGFGYNFKDSIEHDNEILRKEEYLGDHKYEYNKELEKSEEKDTVSVKDSEDRVSWDVNDKVARILKLVQFDDANECRITKNAFQYNDSNDKYSEHTGNMNLELWAGHNYRYSYYVLFVMVFTIAIGIFLKSTDRLLTSIKVFFDMMFVSCWSWAKGVMSPIENNDGNLLLLTLCTPLFVFLLVLYAGFSIVYFANKALLSRVPDKIAEQVNLKKIKELSTLNP